MSDRKLCSGGVWSGVLAVAGLSLPGHAHAQQPYLVADINPGIPSQTSTRSLASVGRAGNGLLYFAASDPVHGGSVWQTDGTPSGTARITAFELGDQGIDFGPGLPGALLAVPQRGPLQLFHCPEGQAPVLLKTGVVAVEQGDNFRTPLFRATPTKIYFVLRERDVDDTLWVSDGSVAGTHLVKDLTPGQNLSPQFRSMTVIGEQLFFFATSPATGYELWTSDGTEAGTVCMDIFPGTPSGVSIGSLGIPMFAHNGVVYFSGNNGQTGPELWRSDGTPGGTHLVADLYPGPSASAITAFASAGPVFFFTDGQLRLYRSDGTLEGTILTPVGGVQTQLGRLVGVEGAVYVIANSALRRTDGTPAGTTTVSGGATMLLGPLPGAGPGLPGRVLFTRAGSLWVSDGTDAGTSQLLGAPPSINTTGIGAINGRVVYAGSGPMGVEPYASDGTAAGTVLLRDIARAWSDSTPVRYRGVDEVTYFDANQAGEGSETFVTEDQPGAIPCEPSIPGTPAFGRRESLSIPGGPTFHAQLETGNNTLRVSSSPARIGSTIKSTSGTRLLTDRFGYLAALDTDTVLFEAESPELPATETGASTLWRSDGTSLSTAPVRTIADGGPVHPTRMIVIDGVAYFVALTQNASTAPLAVWRSDGTRDGTVPLVTFASRSLSGTDTARNYLQVGDRLFFTATTTTTSFQLALFAFDRVALTVTPIAPAGGSAMLFSASAPRAMGGFVYAALSANPASTISAELYRSDGTGDAQLVKEISPGAAGSGPLNLTVVEGPAGERLFFSADDGEHGRELWVSDGTETGTRLVRDIWPGGGSSAPRFFTDVNGTLHFVAGDGVNGFEIWTSDGTEQGTVRVTDLGPGIDSPGIRGLFFDGDTGVLHFDAVVGDFGREPWGMWLGPGLCRADFNHDGFPDAMDLADFINCYYGQCFPGSSRPPADFNGDGHIDADDLAEFVNEYFDATANGC